MIERVVEPHVVPLVGDLTVKRLLPRGGKGVGPFVFLDHFGPWRHEPGINRLDVAPHPHIGLSTLTYLLEGEMLHRDSLGTVQTIVPGAVNWMTAGKGIVHSERVSERLQSQSFTVHGLQAWVALPESYEETAPAFEHHGVESIPRWQEAGVGYALIAGEVLGKRSPVRTFSKLFYLWVDAPPGSELRIDPEGQEACFYLMEGELTVQDHSYRGPLLLIFKIGEAIAMTATTRVRATFLGGDSLGPRHMAWNFVSSSSERIERAKQAWRERRFPAIPGETEWIPFPERP